MSERGRRAIVGVFRAGAGVIALLLGAAATAQVADPVIDSTAIAVAETGNLAIPPEGIDVTVTCATGAATIHYTTDGSEPTESSATVASGSSVHIDEQTGLTIKQSIVFKAKAFTTTESSNTVSETYFNYSDPEFSMSFKVDGVDPDFGGSGVLTFGLKTGATDGADLFDAEGLQASQAPPVGTPEPVPSPPVVTALFMLGTTAEEGFLSTDMRTRASPKLWPLQLQLIHSVDGNGDPGPAEITLSWGDVAGAGFPIPENVASLQLLRRIATTGTEQFEELADLLAPGGGSFTCNTSTYDYLGYDLLGAPDSNGEYVSYVTLYVYYENTSDLTVNLGPSGVPGTARWQYQGVGQSAPSDPLVSGTKVNLHPGTYDIEFGSVDSATGYYRPLNQTVVLASNGSTVLNVDYLTVECTASQTVVDSYYDPAGGTVDVDCTFTYTPDVTLTELVWTYASGKPPSEWDISGVTGPDGADASFDADAGTVTFASARGIPLSNPIQFTVTFTYPDQGPDPQDIIFDATVAATSDAGVLSPPSVDSGVSHPRVATLDVQVDSDYDVDDLVLIYKKWYAYDRNVDAVGSSAALNMIVPGDAVAAQAVVDAVEAMGDQLDMDQDADTDVDDLVLIYKKWYAYDRNVDAVGSSAALNMIIPGNPIAAQHVVDQVDALSPAIP
jgi:hypothetical protein